MNRPHPYHRAIAAILLATLCLALPALAANRRNPNKSNQKPPPPPKESYWTVTAVDASNKTVSATHTSGDTKTFKTTSGTSVRIDGKSDKVANLAVGMRLKITEFGEDILSRVDAKSAAGGGAAAPAAGAGTKKKK